MKRAVDERLRSWKSATHRKPLIVRGARQVGKTWSIDQFGRAEFRNVVTIDFEKRPLLNEVHRFIEDHGLRFVLLGSSGRKLKQAGTSLLAGMVYGKTDEYGSAAVEHRMHVHDFQATILHLLGLDRERRTYRHAGRDYPLTDVAGEVAREIQA